MGISIDAHVYDIDTLIESIIAARSGDESSYQLGIVELLAKIMPEFGRVFGNEFVVIWNEYYAEYNPAIEFLQFIERYYGIEDFFPGDYDTITGGACADDVAEAVGIELPLKEDDDEV